MATLISIVNLVGGWRAALFAVLGVALGATAVIQSYRLDRARDNAGLLAARVATFELTQTANLSTIDDLRETNRAWAAKCSLDPTAAKEAAAATEQASGALPADDQRRTADRSHLYAQDQDAAAWGRQRVPSGVSERLRK